WDPRRVRILHWDGAGGESTQGGATGRGAGANRLLNLVGRHPFLTLDQLQALLDTDGHALRRRVRALVAQGWLARQAIGTGYGLAVYGPSGQRRSLELLEVTAAGRAMLGGWLALRSAPATRYHGLIGGERGRGGHRRRLLRTLAHTLGANA